MLFPCQHKATCIRHQTFALTGFSKTTCGYYNMHGFQCFSHKQNSHIAGLLQDCSSSSALALNAADHAFISYFGMVSFLISNITSLSTVTLRTHWIVLPMAKSAKSLMKHSIFFKDVTKWIHFSHYWPFVRGIHRLIAAKRPVARSFDVFFDLRPNKRLS